MKRTKKKVTYVIIGILILVCMTTVLTACGLLFELLFDDSAYATVSSSESRDSSSSSSSGSSSGTVTSVSIASGTYTFYPRLRANKGGIDVNVYLDRIEVRNNMISFFMVDKPISNGRSPDGNWNYNYSRSEDFVLQDLDRPSRTWNRNSFGNDTASGGGYISFQSVTGSRFSLTSKTGNPSIVFDEIVLGAPDPTIVFPPLKNGTYTFYPRLQAIRSGLDIDTYIDRITVRGEFLNVFLTNVPVGRGRGPAGSWGSSYATNSDLFIQDLDYPARTWVRTNQGTDEVTGGVFLTYQGVNATRFSLTNRADNPNIVFEEILLGEPDL